MNGSDGEFDLKTHFVDTLEAEFVGLWKIFTQRT